MSLSRPNITWNNGTYFKKLKKLVPRLNEGGACYGQAHTAKNALISTDVSSFLDRQEVFEVGAPFSAQDSDRVSMEDIQEAATSLGIDTRPSLENSENKHNDAKLTIANPPQNSVTKVDLFCELLEKYQPDAIPHIKKIFFPKATQNDSAMDVESKAVSLSPDELIEQVNLAKKVRSEYIAKGKRFSPARLKQKFPFIDSLCETEVFSHHVALFQNGDQFTELFNETNQPHSQVPAAAIFNSLLSPVADQSLKIGEIQNLSSTNMLQILFDALEKLIIPNNSESQKMEDEDEERLDELPFALVISHFKHHAITVGYSAQQRKWILFDINQRPFKLISGPNLSEELFFAAICCCSLTIISTHAEAEFGCLEKTKEWIILKLKEKPSSKPELNPISYQVIQTLKNKLRTIHELRLIINGDIYVGSKIDPKILNKIKQWMSSATFKNFSRITYGSTSLDDITQQSLLNYAACFGKIHLARQILSLNKKLLEHEFPLIDAICNRETEMVAFLLSQGANPNNPLNSGSLPSTYAAEYGSLDIVKLLHEAKANFELRYKGDSPLRFAVYNNHLQIVAYLLNEAKVDPNACDHLSHTAAEKGYVEIVKLLHEAKANFELTYKGNSPLSFAVHNNHLQIVAYLLNEAKVDPNAGDYPSLNVAAEKGYVEIVKLFLATGKADIHKCSVNKFTPLMMAVSYGQWQVAELLLAADPKPFKSKPTFMYPNWREEYFRQVNQPKILTDAIEHHQTKMVAFLLSQGADPNTHYNSGMPHPIAAARYGFLDIIKLLHEANANFELTHEGSSPLGFASSFNHPHVVDYLLNKVKVNPNAGIHYDSLSLAAQKGHVEIVELLLATKKVDINRKSRDTRLTPLITAVYQGHWQVAELLLAANPEPFEPQFFEKEQCEKFLLQFNQPDMQRVFSEYEERRKMMLKEVRLSQNRFSRLCCRKRKEVPKEEEKPTLTQAAKRARI